MSRDVCESGETQRLVWFRSRVVCRACRLVELARDEVDWPG